MEPRTCLVTSAPSRFQTPISWHTRFSLEAKDRWRTLGWYILQGHKQGSVGNSDAVQGQGKEVSAAVGGGNWLRCCMPHVLTAADFSEIGGKLQASGADERVLLSPSNDILHPVPVSQRFPLNLSLFPS